MKHRLSQIAALVVYILIGVATAIIMVLGAQPGPRNPEESTGYPDSGLGFLMPYLMVGAFIATGTVCIMLKA